MLNRLNRGNFATASFAACLSLLMTMQAEANVMFMADSATIIDNGSADIGFIANTHNQNGLATGYTSGSTPFDDYVDATPLHSNLFSGNEFEGSLGSSNKFIVVYEFNQAIDLAGVALWNEDTYGIGSFQAFASTDGTSFGTAFLSEDPVSPNTTGADYGPYKYDSFAQIDDVTHVKFEMSASSGFIVGIGEIAFGGTASSTNPPVVPEPTSFATWGLLVGAVAAARRRRK